MPWISKERLHELERAERFVQRAQRANAPKPKVAPAPVQSVEPDPPAEEKVSDHWPTIHDASQIYGVSEKTIRRRISDGTLDAKRIGPRLIRINPKSLERWGTPIQYIERGHA